MGDAEIVYDEQPGNVLHLDGDGDYMDIGNGEWTNPGDEFTVTAWVKVDNFDTAYQTVLAKGDQAYRLSRYGDTSDSMSIYMNSDSSTYHHCDGETNVNDGQWHYLAATYDGQDLKLYIDGVVEPETATFSGLNNNTDPLWVGGNSQWSLLGRVNRRCSFLPGSVDGNSDRDTSWCGILFLRGSRFQL